MPWTWTEHADADALAATLAARLSTATDQALREHGAATLALAGGRTAPPVLRRFAGEARDWSRVTILPTDERWVRADHADCNLRQLHESFASVAGIHWMALVPQEPHGVVDAAFANAQLQSLAGPIDATMLGMGADGHFASLFPGAQNLAAALDPKFRQPAVAIVPDPLPTAGPHPRISLSLARLLHSRHVILAITGADKRAVLERAIAENDAARLPVAALLHAPDTIIEIHWSP